jgi:Dolichyl-phosphate-mannose-protein mannosyltransferase
MSQRKFPHWLALVVSLGIFTLLRLPAVLHQPGGQDEQFFAVPGYTVWTEGIPRIPFYPARHRSTLFERSDRCLLAMPPGLFYCQAPLHAFFPPGYPTARLPLYIAGLIAIVLVYFISISLHASPLWAFVASIIFAISRPLLFTGTIARPDLLCVVCGLGAILVWLRSLGKPSTLPWIAIGGLCGLACLFHPYGLIFCIQAGLAAILSIGSIQARSLRVTFLIASVCIVLSLWLPLILEYPEEFRTQFFANIFDRAGPGLPSRLAWPFPSFSHHCRLIWEFVGPCQCLLYGTTVTLGCVVVGLRMSALPERTPPSSNATLKQLLSIVLSSIYLTAAVAGIHPTKGYWVYPTAMILVLAAVLASQFLTTRLAQRILITTLLLLMIPGAGLRTAWVYIRYWGDPTYHAPSFIQNVLKDYPQEGLYLADLSYVFDIYLSGRKTILLKDRTDYADQIDLDCDYIFSAWEGNDAGWADQYGPHSVRHQGIRIPDQACYVDVLTPVGKQKE